VSAVGIGGTSGAGDGTGARHHPRSRSANYVAIKLPPMAQRMNLGGSNTDAGHDGANAGSRGLFSSLSASSSHTNLSDLGAPAGATGIPVNSGNSIAVIVRRPPGLQMLQRSIHSAPAVARSVNLPPIGNCDGNSESGSLLPAIVGSQGSLLGSMTPVGKSSKSSGKTGVFK
jgi:hypothetical protein